MKIFKSIYLKSLSLCLALCSIWALTGCKDELTLNDGSDNSSGVEVEGDCIQFTMKLDRDISSRSDDMFTSAIESYENYIDTQDKFRVFFFAENGDFLFGANDRTVGSMSNTDVNADYWYVRIPMTMLVDRDNQEYDVEKIKNYLKKHPFKIAVLANWPNGGEKVNPADWDDSEGTPDGGANPSSTLKGHPKWNWSNSILNIDAKPADIRNINDLHHVYHDKYYEGTANRINSYGPFMAYGGTGEDRGYQMGEPTDWVQMRNITDGWKVPADEYKRDEDVPDFTSKETANAWIRANCSPNVDLNEDKRIYRHYQHMWFLWNFDASFKTGASGKVEYKKTNGQEELDEAGYRIPVSIGGTKFYENNWGWNDGSPATITNRFGFEWYKRNGEYLYRKMLESYNGGGRPNVLGDILIERGHANNDVFFRYVSVNGFPAYCVNVEDNYGIQLPAIGSGKKTNYEGMLNFQARTSGTLRIKWSSADENVESGLAVQVGLSGIAGTDAEKKCIYKECPSLNSTQPTNWKDLEGGLEYLDISVPEGSLPVYIFCTKGKAVVYSVEFIRGSYLFETDREGVLPNENQGIPMYGVQDFPAIPDWQRGTTINISDQTGNNVNLIRALAKVEVYISKSYKAKPRHVYMRNMNRVARCEPMDVHNSTELLFGDEKDHMATDNNGNYLCEWFRIQQYGPSYQTPDYVNWLSWFYGSWQRSKFDNEDRYKQISWKNNGKDANYVVNYSASNQGDHIRYYVARNMTGWDQNNSFESKYATLTQNMKDQTPPHLFNPYIYRNDFCRFLEVPTDDNYYKYILYLPEKNIDDPTVAGQMESDPKVPHIEYRFEPKAISKKADEPSAVDEGYYNSEYNLDDNDCFRIYFTSYSANGTNGVEANPEIIDKKVKQSTYDAYERNKNNLKYHWPIMRNHKYSFHVGGEGPQNPDIHVEVSDWGHRKVIVTW